MLYLVEDIVGDTVSNTSSQRLVVGSPLSVAGGWTSKPISMPVANSTESLLPSSGILTRLLIRNYP